MVLSKVDLQLLTSMHQKTAVNREKYYTVFRKKTGPLKLKWKLKTYLYSAIKSEDSEALLLFHHIFALTATNCM